MVPTTQELTIIITNDLIQSSIIQPASTPSSPANSIDMQLIGKSVRGVKCTFVVGAGLAPESAAVNHQVIPPGGKGVLGMHEEDSIQSNIGCCAAMRIHICSV